MKRFLLAFFLLSLPVLGTRGLLDKIALVINDQVLTLSEIAHIKKTLTVRGQLSPQIYTKKVKTLKDVSELLIRKMLIRKKLEKIGYIITDEQVDAQIKQTEKRLNVGREELLSFLKQNKITFKEYFEL